MLWMLFALDHPKSELTTSHHVIIAYETVALQRAEVTSWRSLREGGRNLFHAQEMVAKKQLCMEVACGMNVHNLSQYYMNMCYE